jgi:hypothetical protein
MDFESFTFKGPDQNGTGAKAVGIVVVKDLYFFFGPSSNFFNGVLHILDKFFSQFWLLC